MSCEAFCIFLFLICVAIVHQISQLTYPVNVKTAEELKQNNISESSEIKDSINLTNPLDLSVITNLSTNYIKTSLDSDLQEKYVETPWSTYALQSRIRSSKVKAIKKLEPLNYVNLKQPLVSEATMKNETKQPAEKDYITHTENKETPELQLLSKYAELIDITQTTNNTSSTSLNSDTEQLSSPLPLNRLLDYNTTDVSTKSSKTKISTRFSPQHNTGKRDPCNSKLSADCISRESLKITDPSQPRGTDTTIRCPGWYGHYPLDNTECSKYIRCNFWRPIIMPCPLGLVFNAKLEACDWPANVPTCNPKVFHGFNCPVSSKVNKYGTSHEIMNIRLGQSCKKYIACQEGSPRFLHCDHGLSFSDEIRRCIRSDFVSNCRND